MISLASASQKLLSAGFMQIRALLALPQKDSLGFGLHDSSVAAAATRELLGVQIAVIDLVRRGPPVVHAI